MSSTLPRGRVAQVIAVVALLALVGVGYLFVGGPAVAPEVGASPEPAASSSGRATPGARADRTPSPAASTDPESGLSWVALTDLPTQVTETVQLIDAGGPYPYAKDGSVFGNFEGVLPDQRRGYYREYTVPTPGSRDRGARRIVTGDGTRQFFYTDDHYDTFRRIRR